MSIRKTNIEKNCVDKKKNELLELKSKLEILRKYKNKVIFKRNIKVAWCYCNFAIPIIVSFGLIIGIFKSLGGGLPFVKDDTKKYKKYDFEYQTEKGALLEDKYLTYWESEDEKVTQKNKLIITLPWVFVKDNLYTRKIRTYKLKNMDFFEVKDAILKNDINYINEKLSFTQTIEFTNKVPSNYEESITASLYYLDSNDILKVKESNLKNIIITLVEILLGLGIGFIVNNCRSFDFDCEIDSILSDYENEKSHLEEDESLLLSLIKEGKK